MTVLTGVGSNEVRNEWTLLKCVYLTHFLRARKQQFDYTFQKNYISTVIYHSLKSYTSFERTYNKLSKKNLAVWKPIILHWKKLQDTFSFYLCKNSNIKCDFSKIILGLKEIFFSSYLAKQTTNQLKILNDAEFFY